MDNRFPKEEELYRAVYPPDIQELYWKKDGTLSSAAFKDKRGLSVERGYFREDKVVVDEMRKYFTGVIISVVVKDCYEAQTLIRYLPSDRSKYHSEIHRDKEHKLLSQSQCKILAKKARIVRR